MSKLRTSLLVCALLACLAGASFVFNPSRADGGADHQVLNNNYGVKVNLIYTDPIVAH